MYVLFLFRRWYDRHSDPKKYEKKKSDHNLSGKKRGRLSVCLRLRFESEVKISVRNSQNWAGHRNNATCSPHSIRLGIVFLVELISATDIDRLLLCWRLSTPIFTLIGNDDFWSFHLYFRPKISPKIDNLEFSWISRRDRVGFPDRLDLHMRYCCAAVSASNVLSPTRYVAVVDEIRIYGWILWDPIPSFIFYDSIWKNNRSSYVVW